MTALVPSTGSVFDSLRIVRADGSEFWSARELMTELAYDRWENFSAAIDRARAAATNSGCDASELFRGVTKNSGGRPAEDVELARFAAYLVAMNGDPRKEEVARAQQYFAIRTREAETAPPAIVKPETREQLLARAVLEATAAMAEKDDLIAELAPKAEVADRLLDAEGDMSVGDTAKALTRAGIKVGEQRLFAALESRKWIYRAKGDGRWRVYQTAIESGHMSVIPQSHYHPRTGVLVLDPPQVRITAKGLQRLLLDHGAVVPT